jgi:hypothetical protein
MWAIRGQRINCFHRVYGGDDGRTVSEVIFAAYESARTERKVELLFKTYAAKPWDRWGKR